MNPDLEQHPGLLLHDIARLFRQCFGQRLRDLGLSEAQWRALGTVNKFPGISQTQLAQLLGIGKVPLGKLIHKLEAEGLLLRSADSADSRVKLLRIAASAAPLTQLIVDRHSQFQNCYLRGVSPRRQQQLERTLKTMHHNLSEQSGTEPGPANSQALTLMHLISGISRLNSRLFNLQLKQIGFTRSQWLVMTAIGRREGWQQSQLAQELNMGKAPLGVLIDELEAGNWVQRRVHPQDRRARTLHLTRDCRRQLQSLGESFEELHTSALTGVAERERQSLSASLTSIRDQLKFIAKGNSDEPREENT
ncbi:MAG: MarR family transcriptional regulator [Gammaproteobacteria bacterium]|nr:MarR family transcriptional regulator [Gammaproteobacteria bacterium]